MKTTKKVKKVVKKVAKRVAKKPLTEQQRRIIILQDAVDQIRANNIAATCGTVVSLSYDIGETYDANAKPILEKFFKIDNRAEKQQPCESCARGSLLLCMVHKENKFLLSEFDSLGGSYDPYSKTDSRLLELFSEEQIAMMETAFEIENVVFEEDFDEEYDDKMDLYGYNLDTLGEELSLKCIAFGRKYSDTNTRLVAIFENAIKNKGIFKP